MSVPLIAVLNAVSALTAFCLVHARGHIVKINRASSACSALARTCSRLGRVGVGVGAPSAAAIECSGAAGAPLADSKGQTNQLYNFALRPNLAAGHLAAQLLAKVIDLSFNLDLPRAHLFAAACIAHICANHAVNHCEPPASRSPFSPVGWTASKSARCRLIDGPAPRCADRRNAKPPPHTSANRFPFNYANCTSLETN